MSLLSLGTVTLLDTAWSGFDAPQSAQVVALLGDGTSAVRNAVLQSSAMGFRQGTVSFVAADADCATVRGWYEDSATQTFTDRDGSTCDAVVLDFSRSETVPGLWACQAVLLQLSDPVLGS